LRKKKKPAFKEKKILLFIFTKMKKLKEVTEDRVGGVPSNLVLGGITDQTILRSESNIGRCRSVSLIIHYYLYSFMLPHCHARVRCTQINPNRLAFSLVRHCRAEREVQGLWETKMK
jgi:hypothetical protein